VFLFNVTNINESMEINSNVLKKHRIAFLT
jgi:hypothetical protein